MTPEEMRDLFATIVSFDGRTVDARTIIEWHALIGSIPAELARQAVRVWYSENRGFIQPHDVAVTAARLAGLDQEPSVTQRRIEGVPQPWDAETVVKPWAPPGIERKSDEGMD